MPRFRLTDLAPFGRAALNVRFTTLAVVQLYAACRRTLCFWYSEVGHAPS